MISSNSLFTAEPHRRKHVTFEIPPANLAVRVLLKATYEKPPTHSLSSCTNFEQLSPLKIGETIATPGWNFLYTESFFQFYIKGKNLKHIASTTTGGPIYLVTKPGPVEVTQLYWTYKNNKLVQHFKKYIIHVTE